MRRILLLLIVAISSIVHAQDPNLQRGFSPGKAYDFLGLDTVSLMNGNLNVRIPLGQQYSVGPVLTYQFMLAYNSKVWEIEYAGPGGDPQLPQSWAVPETRSNAGFGWQLTLGTLLPPKVHSVQGPQQGWTYLAPDGSEHEFPTVGDVSVVESEDGSYLRLRRLPDITDRVGYHEIDFPNGIIRQFDGDHNLTEIRDRYGYKIKVARTTTQWTVTEEAPVGGAGRTHTILFDPALNSDGDPYLQDNFETRPVEVNLAAFGASTNVATYQLAYTDTKVQVGPCAASNELENMEFYIPHLNSITLPDQSTFSMAYLSTPVDRCTQATLNVLTLPTRGKIRWDFGSYELTNQACIRPRAGVLEDGWRKVHAGVRLRTLLSADETIVEKRTYTPDLPMRLPMVEQRCSAGTQMWLLEKPPDVFKNTVTVSVPTGSSSERTVEKTTHYFSAYPAEVDGTMTGGALVSPALGIEYGLPLARGTFVGDTEETKRFLSSQVYSCDGTTCSNTVARTTYLRYALEQSFGVSGQPKAKNPRVEAHRTVFEDDSCGGSCRYYTDSSHSNWDGYGHYRQSVLTSNIPGTPEKTTFKDYSPDATNWLLEVYDDAWVKESTGSITIGARSQATFDPVTGALISQRTYKATGSDPATYAQSSNDLLSAWCRNSATGFISSERHFGGDLTAIPSGHPCTAARGAGHYFIDHSYQLSGSTVIEHTAQYSETTHFITDDTFDANTGRVSSSRDSAGVNTDFIYDTSGRLTTVKPAGEASASYEYSPNANPPAVIARQCSTGTDQCPTDNLTESRFYYDPLGRLMEERRRMLGGQWSAQWTTYDALSRQRTRTVPVAVSSGLSGNSPSARETSWAYDFLGRVIKETRPDDSETTLTYAGVRSTTRTSNIATGASETPVSVTEEYDGHGRLVAVTENSADGGSAIKTEYTYDAGNRVATVTMGNGQPSRVFNYDGRGFLSSETHPESGATFYTYDARGHAVSRDTPEVDLTFQYDAAERLKRVTDSATGVLKELYYDRPNNATPNGTDFSLGKLDYAIRHNGLPSAVSGDGDIQVKETYFYDDAGGRLSSKVTAVDSVPALTESYVYDPLRKVTAVTYPNCTVCSGLSAPSRTVNSTFSNGLLTKVTGYTDPVNLITYHPNGLLNTLQHISGSGATGPLYAQTLSSTKPMPRPDRITVTTFCASLRIVQQPTSANLQVNATGATGYQWYERIGSTDSVLSGQTSSTLSLQITTPRWFWVRVNNGVNACWVDSDVVLAEVSCAPPVADIVPPAGPVLSSVLYEASVANAPGATYQWSILSGNGTLVGSTTNREVSFRPGCSGSLTLKVIVTNCGNSVSDTLLVNINQPTGTLSGSAVIAQGSSATIALALEGTGPFNVTWNPGGPANHSSSPISKPVSPSQTTTYTITSAADAYGCAINAGGSATITVLPNPVMSGASAISANNVRVMWAYSGAVDSFTIQRYSRAGGSSVWQTVASNIPPGWTSFDDPSAASGAAYLYRVKAVKSGVSSIWSASDLAGTTMFDDDPIVSTTVADDKHVLQLRSAVDAIRSLANLSAAVYSGVPPALDVEIAATHIGELRVRLNEGRAALASQGLSSLVAYTDDPLAPGQEIKAEHITQLRGGVK